MHCICDYDCMVSQPQKKQQFHLWDLFSFVVVPRVNVPAYHYAQLRLSV